jgi:hypothetical protein
LKLSRTYHDIPERLMTERLRLPRIGGRTRNKIVELIANAHEGLSRADLARRFNTSIGAVAVMVHGANAQLKPHGFRIVMYHGGRKSGHYRLIRLAPPLQLLRQLDDVGWLGRDLRPDDFTDATDRFEGLVKGQVNDAVRNRLFK